MVTNNSVFAHQYSQILYSQRSLHFSEACSNGKEQHNQLCDVAKQSVGDGVTIIYWTGTDKIETEFNGDDQASDHSRSADSETIPPPASTKDQQQDKWSDGSV